MKMDNNIAVLKTNILNQCSITSQLKLNSMSEDFKYVIFYLNQRISSNTTDKNNGKKSNNY